MLLKQVLFEGKLWHLSPLVFEIYKRKGQENSSGSYRGPAYFEFKGVKLVNMKNTL